MAQSISQEAIGATGLPGATAASRHAGATTSGAPTTGTFAVGDFIVDQTGAMYVCTVAGTPGTWQLSGVSVNENIAGKNILINGGMDIWQRGTTFVTGGNYNVYTADRWTVGYNTNLTASQAGIGTFIGTSTATSSTSLTMSSATWSVNAYVGSIITAGSSTATVVSNTATVLTVASWTGGTPTTGSFLIAGFAGFNYALRLQRTSGGTSTGGITIMQNVESNNSIPLAGKTATISFYARAGANFSSASNALSVLVDTGSGTDQNRWGSYYAYDQTVLNSSVTLTTSFQKFTFTFSVPSTTTQICPQFVYTPVGTAGANDYYDITGVQLEIAPQATPFSRAGGSIGAELALCQRYYQRIGGSYYSPENVGVGTAGTTTAGYINCPTKQVLRTGASFNAVFGASSMKIANAGGTQFAMTSASLAVAGTNAVLFSYNVASGLTAGQPVLCFITGTDAYIELNAEL